ncbi:unnamed protein product [Rotaria sp. Silwood2]|nr:unnamed protein product [Rotaria sp. Silwood2]
MLTLICLPAFTCIIQIFAECLSWNNLKQLLNGFQSRLNSDIKQELYDEHILEFDTDSNDESENEYDISSSRVSSTIQFPALLDDKNIHIRNAYIDRKHICSEFILMIEHKETIAISCFTKKLTKQISDSNVFHINNQEELHL